MIRKLLLSLLILFAATSAVNAEEQSFNERKANLAEVNAVRFSYGSGTIRVVIDVTKKVEFTESYVENPSRVIIDLKNAWLSPNVKREIEFKSLAAKKLRIAQFDPSTVRIVIESTSSIKPFHLSGGAKGYRLVIDIGNTAFKGNSDSDKSKTDIQKEQQERELKEQRERELKEQRERELKEQQERELKEQQERELKEQRERELKEQRERELKEQRERELKEQRERELKEQRERELKEQRERELKEQRERELKEQRERELKEQKERELKEQKERELKEQKERELKEQKERELKEQRERELKEQKEREKKLKEQKERELKEQREREKKLEKERKEKEKQERREKKEKEKLKDRIKNVDLTDSENDGKEVDKPFTELDNDLRNVTTLSGKIIVIDPGHGGNDAGAIGPTGVMEKNVTLKVALEVQRLLEAEGAKVVMTRDTDRTVSPKGAAASDIEELGARCDVANRVNADIFISIHADSFTRPEARGTTGYYYSKSTSGKGQKLADCIRRNLVEQLGTPSRGTQPCNFYVVKHTDMPATLIELGFISNKDEEKLLNSDEGVKKAAQAILDGIEDYFG